MQKKEKTLIFEILLVGLTLVLGIFNAFRSAQFLEIQKVSSTSILHFIAYFIIGTLLVLLVSSLGDKFKKGKSSFFKIVFVITAGWGSLVSLSLWMPDSLAFALTVILLFLWVKRAKVLWHNLTMILGMAGIGGILGLSFDPEAIIFLLVIFSIYDYIAVYKTKHMVKMAKEMIEAKAIVGLILPKRIKHFWQDLKDVEPGGKFMILGGGDVIFPLLLCVSVTPLGILKTTVISLFCLAGIVFSFFVFIKKRKPIPALPPITLFAVIGYFIIRFLI